jgi:predicted transcriptional regulator
LFLLRGTLVSAIWFAAIGWFLTQAARSSYADVELRGLLRTVEAEDLMSPNLVSVPADIPLTDAVDSYFMRYDHAAFPVEQDGRTVGLLTVRAVRRVGREGWPSRTVRDAMEPLGTQCTVEATAPMDRVVAKLQDGLGRCLVTRNGEVVGIITPSDIARWLQRRRALTD